MQVINFLPFSSPRIIRHHLGKAKTILDVGCGDGSFMEKINFDNKYLVTGVELYKPFIKKALQKGIYKTIKTMDIRKIRIKSKSFDVVLASQVIEHVNKKDGLNLIKKLEKIAKDKVILTTPNGFVEYDPFDVYDDNKLQKHKSGWDLDELRDYGYGVYGQGSGFIYNPEGLLYKFRKFKNIWVIMSFLLAPVNYFFPKLGAYIVAVKSKQNR